MIIKETVKCQAEKSHAEKYSVKGCPDSQSRKDEKQILCDEDVPYIVQDFARPFMSAAYFLVWVFLGLR